MIRRRIGFSTMAVVVAVLVTVLVAPLARGATPTDGCCATCIGKTSSVAYTYDPVVYAQCSAAGGVCCFNCDGEKSSPTIENASYGDDGETPQVAAGEWIQITWTNIARVTYETYKANQNKTTTVTNSSAEATLEDGVFFICAKSAGSVVVRGWGSDPCTTATPESKIVVTTGSGNGTCASRTPTAPSSSNSSATSSSSTTTAPATDEDSSLSECNLQRASIVTVDGTKTCVCAAEWTGAPECAGYPWWKTAATIGGGVAALLSIAVSVKAFMNARKAKQLEEQQGQQRADQSSTTGPALGEETIRIAADPEPSNRASDQPYAPPPTSAKARDNKEYTL